MQRIINLRPSRPIRVGLGLLPFVLLALVYLLASDARLADNPNDKLLPSLSSFGDAIQRMAFEPSKRTGDYILWADTTASLIRLSIGISVSALLGLITGIALGALPFFRAGFSPLVNSLSLIPPLALLPVLFIVFGLGELSKVILIVFGTMPFITRDVQLRVMEIPKELIIKAQTLGASTWQIIIRVILPLALPKLINAVRLSLGSAWLFLIAAEAIAATNGLGYRIFLVRRYLAMDTIIPYVIWITLLAYLTDYLLAQLSRLAFRWQQLEQEDS